MVLLEKIIEGYNREKEMLVEALSRLPHTSVCVRSSIEQRLKEIDECLAVIINSNSPEEK